MTQGWGGIETAYLLLCSMAWIWALLRGLSRSAGSRRSPRTADR